jgi:hypothetical protein
MTQLNVREVGLLLLELGTVVSIGLLVVREVVKNLEGTILVCVKFWRRIKKN